MGIDGDGWLESRKGQRHALILPISLQAHLAGIFRHAIELAKRGVTVTFVGLERDIKLLKGFDELRGLDFNLLSYQDFGPSEKPGDTWTISRFLASVRNKFQPIFEKLLADQKAGRPGPTCIISDRLLTWPATEIAKELKVPYYQFYSCGATFVRILQASPKLFADGTLMMKQYSEGHWQNRRSVAEFEGHLEVAGLPAFTFREMLNPSPGVDFIIDIGNVIVEADGVIVNTFYELEIPQIDAIRQSWEEDFRGKIRKLFLVGPLSNAATFRDRSFVTDLGKSRIDCLQWLDSRSPHSVIYICLGSMVRFNPEQITELALALMASEQSFLWVLHREARGESSSKLEDILPPNFEAQTRGKGLIVEGWVPQLHILSHSSIAGFLTHCGWNSIIESITSGVPMIAWPQMPVEQFINARHLVDVLRIAVEVNGRIQDPKWNEGQAFYPCCTSPSEHVELEKAMRLLMSEEGNAMRKRVQGLKMKAEAAVADGGASKNALDDLAESIPRGTECLV